MVSYDKELSSDVKGRNLAVVFTYIKPEFMIHAFKQQRDTLLNDRGICVARLGDIAVTMDKVDENSFSLSLENITNGVQYAGRIFNIVRSDPDEVVPLVEELFKKMQLINDKDIFEKRETIWRWYAMSWLEEQDISLDEYLETRMLVNSSDDQIHWKSFEEYISDDYLNVAATVDIIERFASDEEKEIYKTFAAKDIVELSQRRSYESIQESFENAPEEDVQKSYSFAIDVTASSRTEAREKLSELLKTLGKGKYNLRG